MLVLHTAFYSGFDRQSGYNVYTSRLEIGVSVFFLVSGFLLYRPFAVSHLSRRPAPAIGKFWVRRLLRILPAYWFALTVITYVLHDASAGSSWQGVLAQYGLVQIYFPSEIFNGIGQAWSLCTEMGFYLFLPLYVMLVAVRRRSQSSQLARELIGLVALVLVSFVYRDWVLNLHSSCAPNCLTHPALSSTMTSWLPGYFDLFALGMLLAVVSAWFTERNSEPAWLRHPLLPWVSWICAAIAFWGVSQLGIPSSHPIYVISPSVNLVKQSLYGVFAFFLLLPAVFGPQEHGLIRRMLRAWPVVGLGVISYGIYLWHQAWIQELLPWGASQQFVVSFLLLTLTALSLSVLSASASYFGLEHRLLQLKDRIGWWNRPSSKVAPGESRPDDGALRDPVKGQAPVVHV